MSGNDVTRPGSDNVDELLNQLLDDDAHMPYEQLEALVDGTLSPADVAAAEAHIVQCPACRSDLAHLRNVAAAAQREPQSTRVASDDVRTTAARQAAQSEPATILPMRSGASRRRWTSWAPALAAAAVLVAVVWTANRRGEPSLPPVEQSLPAATQAPPSRVLPLDKPDVKLSPGALTWRGSTNENTYLADLRPALDAYRDGDYAAADRLFADLANKYPSAVEVRFYRGVSRLFLEDAGGAKAALADAERLADSTFASDIAWYQAIADERSGDRAAAAVRLETLCAAAGPRQSSSCNALSAMNTRTRQ